MCVDGNWRGGPAVPNQTKRASCIYGHGIGIVDCAALNSRDLRDGPTCRCCGRNVGLVNRSRMCLMAESSALAKKSR